MRDSVCWASANPGTAQATGAARKGLAARLARMDEPPEGPNPGRFSPEDDTRVTKLLQTGKLHSAARLSATQAEM